MKNFLKSEDGNIVIMAAVLFPVAIGLAAFAIDEGALTLQKRAMQNVADIAAISAAANIGNAEKVARLVLQDNGFGLSNGVTVDDTIDGTREGTVGITPLKVEKGYYVPDIKIAPESRFLVGATTSNAVRVTMQRKGKLYFGSIFTSPPTIEVTSTGSADPEAAFSIGSRLLKLDGGILNAVLNKTLGTNISLSVMDYNALISGDVNVLEFFDALATEMHVKTGTYNDLLSSSATIGNIAKALARSSNSSSADKALSLIAAHTLGTSQVKVPLSHLFGLGNIGKLALGSGSAAFDAKANIMSILTASGAVGNGIHQMQLDLSANLPGLASVTADLAIGEPPQNSPWFSIGKTGEIIRTAQTRLRVIATIDGGGVLAGVTVRIPLYLELAYGEASLADVSCPADPAKASVTVKARPGIADIYIADVDPSGMKAFSKKPMIGVAQIVQSPLLRATGRANVDIGNLNATVLKFSASDISKGVTKIVSTQDFTASALSSLIGDLELNVTVAGLSLGTPVVVQKALSGLLATAAKPLDGVIYNLLTALGISLGQADIRVTGINCQRSVLVQ